MKKEISDHLAKAFFETKGRQNGSKEKNFLFYIAVSFGFLGVFVLGVTYLTNLPPLCLATRGESIKLERHDGPYSLKFDFSQSQSNVSVLNIDLPDIDLNKFHRLVFLIRLRKADNQRLGNLKVSLVNKRRETSSRYISEINPSWKKIVVPFSDFGRIGDLSGPVTLSFTLEPWNTYVKKGELLIDDIQFVKN